VANEKIAYKYSISSLYAANAAFLVTVPFGDQGSGLSEEVTNIISWKILLNARASLFASSIIGLELRRFQGKQLRKELSNHHSLLRRATSCSSFPASIIFSEVGLMRTPSWSCSRPNITTSFTLRNSVSNTRRICRRDLQSTATDRFFHRRGDSLFSRGMQDNVVLPPDSRQNWCQIDG
jgi:hypothetical protein